MEPSNVTVTEGDRVVLRISTDSPVEIHIHGYDLEQEAEPDEPARLRTCLIRPGGASGPR
jgi:hypothetical protein